MLRRAVFVFPFALLPACGPKSDITRSIIGYAQVSSVSALDETRDGFFQYTVEFAVASGPQAM